MIGHQAGHEWRQNEQEDEIVRNGREDADAREEEPARKEEHPERDQDHGKPVRKRGGDGREARMEASMEDHVVGRAGAEERETGGSETSG